MLVADRTSRLSMQEVPHKYKRIVATRSKHAAPRRVPFNAVERCGVPTKFEKSLARLPYVENADNVRVLGEGSEEVRIVGRCGET